MSRIKRRIKTTMNRFPRFFGFFKRVYFFFKYKKEIDLINGKSLSKNQYQSIIHFSFNKAATQYVKFILKSVSSENGMTHIGLNEYAFNTNFPFLDHLSREEMKKFDYLFIPQGYLYSVFGGMMDFPDIDQFKVVLMIRDPRDILVSSYFSSAFSHQEPDRSGDKYERFIHKRQETTQSIDEFVKKQSETLLKYFIRYEELLVKRHPDIYVAFYEEMVMDFDQWLDRMLKYLDLRVSDQLLGRIKNENQKLKPKQENVQKHIRKGQPGDYKDKLQHETIHYLNEKFHWFLQKYNYQT